MTVEPEQTSFRELEQTVAEARQKIEALFTQAGVVFSPESRIGEAVVCVADYIARASKYSPFRGVAIGWNGYSLGLLEIIAPPSVSGVIGTRLTENIQLDNLSQNHFGRTRIRHTKISTSIADDRSNIEVVLNKLRPRMRFIGKIDPIRPLPRE